MERHCYAFTNVFLWKIPLLNTKKQKSSECPSYFLCCHINLHHNKCHLKNSKFALFLCAIVLICHMTWSLTYEFQIRKCESFHINQVANFYSSSNISCFPIQLSVGQPARTIGLRDLSADFQGKSGSGLHGLFSPALPLVLPTLHKFVKSFNFLGPRSLHIFDSYPLRPKVWHKVGNTDLPFCALMIESEATAKSIGRDHSHRSQSCLVNMLRFGLIPSMHGGSKWQF